MGTVIRPVLSEKNKYWIERHRYYELKHFCLQYPEWKKMYVGLEGFSKKASELTTRTNINLHGNPTEKCAISKAFYSDRISMVEDAASRTDEFIGDYILKAVTEGLSYDYLKTKLDIPCSRDTYYDRYRRFFWLLDKERG